MKKRTLFLLILATVTIPLTFASDTQHRFRFYIEIGSEEPSALELRLKTLLQKELLTLGDVDIVEVNEGWKFTINFNILEHELDNGKKTGQLSIAHYFAKAVPKDDFNTYSYEDGLIPIYATDLGVAHWEADNLQQFAKYVIDTTNKGNLELRREFQRFISK